MSWFIWTSVIRRVCANGRGSRSNESREMDYESRAEWCDARRNQPAVTVLKMKEEGGA